METISYNAEPLHQENVIHYYENKQENRNALLTALAQGDEKRAEEILDTQKIDSKTLTIALQEAARNGLCSCIEKLVKENFHFGRVHNNEDSCFLVLLAANNGHEKCVEKLKELGFDINVQGRNEDEMPLHRAAKFNYWKAAIPLLIKCGACVNALDDNHLTALHIASMYGNTECFMALCTANANIHGMRFTPPVLCSAVGKAGNIECIDILLKRGAKVNEADYIKQTPLHYAVGAGRVEFVKRLIDEGADVNARDCLGRIPLFVADEADNPECIQMLIEDSKLNVNAQDDDGNTPLFAAAAHNRARYASILIDQGADVNIRNNAGNTPLFATTIANSGRQDLPECAWILLNRGANINAQNDEGRTIAHEAVMRGNVKSLISIVAGTNQKLDLNIKDKKGKTAWQYATETNCGQCILALKYMSEQDKNDQISLEDYLGETCCNILSHPPCSAIKKNR